MMKRLWLLVVLLMLQMLMRVYCRISGAAVRRYRYWRAFQAHQRWLRRSWRSHHPVQIQSRRRRCVIATIVHLMQFQVWTRHH